MPKIRTYRRQAIPSGSVGAAPRSTRAAITRGELIGRSLKEFGSALKGAGGQIQDANIAEELVSANTELEEVLNKSTEDQINKDNILDRTVTPDTTQKQVALGRGAVLQQGFA